MTYWLETEKDKFKETYTHFLNKTYEFYDRDSRQFLIGVAVEIVIDKFYNYIKFIEKETGTEYLVTENYINFDNTVYWLRKEANCSCYDQMLEVYSGIFGTDKQCFFRGDVETCTVISLDDRNIYHPVFKCVCNGVEKLLDIDYVNVYDNENWFIELKKKYESIEDGYSYRKVNNQYINKEFYALFDDGVKIVRIVKVIGYEMFLVEVVNDRNCLQYEISEDDIYFELTDKTIITLHNDYKVPYADLYRRKYANYLNTEVQFKHNASIETGILIDFVTNNDKKCKINFNGNTINVELKYVNIDKPIDWTERTLRNIRNEQNKEQYDNSSNLIWVGKTKKKKKLVQSPVHIGCEYECYIKQTSVICKVIGKLKDQSTYICIRQDNNVQLNIKLSNINYENKSDWFREKIVNNFQCNCKNIRYKELYISFKMIEKTFCGIGFDNVLSFLENKNNDSIAMMYRNALLAEYNNILAKQSEHSNKKDEHYKMKVNHLREILKLIDNYDGTEQFEYGIQKSNMYAPNSILYFELPGCKQISFHVNMHDLHRTKIQNYKKEWDGIESSTMIKLEEAIREYYKTELS